MDNAATAQEEVFAFLADPATHGGAASKSGASTPTRPRCFSPASARSRSSARCASRFSTIRRSPSARPPARPSSRSTGRLRRNSICGVVAITRATDGALALGGDGTPVEWAVEMRRFDETRRSIIWRRNEIDARSPMRSAARSRPRMRARRRSRPSHGSRRSADYIDEHDAAFGETPELFPAAEIDALAARAAPPIERIRPAPARARRARARPPHPRRSPSRQYRADRRPPGAVRRHRVQPTDRLGRRALRSRLSADGPDRARPAAGRQHRVQPLSRRNARDEDLDALAALPFFMSMRAAIRAKVTAARLERADAADGQRSPTARTLFRPRAARDRAAAAS